MKDIINNFVCAINAWLDEKLNTKLDKAELPCSKTYTAICENDNLVFDEYDTGLVESCFFGSVLNGTRARITWDGVAYECDVKKHGSYYICGNERMAGAALTGDKLADTGEPFVLTLFDDRIGLLTESDKVRDCHSVKIEKVDVQKLEMEYMPDEVVALVNAMKEISYDLNK